MNKNDTLPAHSSIGASSYSRWSKTHGGCPGSVRLSEGIISPESPYAKEGTLAHLVASEILENHFFTMGDRYTIPHNVTPEMMEAVKIYIDYIKKVANDAEAIIEDGHVLIEHKFSLESIYPGLFGTADAVVYFPKEKKLLVADYKHGAGIAVDVEDNLQLQYYALGALISTGLPCDEVEVAVIQPRCGGEPIRKWSFKSSKLIDFAADLEADAHATRDPDAALNPGKHCRFCPAAATKCPAIKDRAQSLAKVEFKNTLAYDPDKLAEALSNLPAIEAWVKRVREFAYAEAMAGRAPSGWKIVAKRGTRKWIKTEEEIVSYMKRATLKDESEFYERKLKSPTQMLLLVNKKLSDKIRPMMQTVVSGYSLVPESDKRPAAEVDPKSVFEVIED
ncbi:MAG: DUF2800 domain-containing protein [Candidatus Saccharibacteria bacterium]|nr:DUF2800 domain-containing protein [Candidatus Saccharibacteria bacterium]